MSASGSPRYPYLFARHLLLASVVMPKWCPGEYRTGNSVTLELFLRCAVHRGAMLKSYYPTLALNKYMLRYQ